MDPPPSTPTPRRFFLPKRSTQSSSQTPAAPPRFQSAPRFGSSSVSRPSQRKELDIEDLEEDEEEEDEVVRSDSSSAGGENTATHDKGKDVLREDAIDTDSDLGAASQEGMASQVRDINLAVHESIDIDSVDLSDSSFGTAMGREAKRRKMSASPGPTSSSPMIKDEEGDTDLHGIDGHEQVEDVKQEVSVTTPRGSEHSIGYEPDAKMPQQPVFQPAPRFKPVEPDDTFLGLPEAFSPRRRGAKYVPGGMAAELQGWLSEVKGWEVTDGEVESTLKIYVDEVSPGGRMYLIKGHATSDEEPKRWILAGEGKLTGLGGRVEVKLGSAVVIEQPVWDIKLEGDVWNVACNWSVESI